MIPEVIIIEEITKYKFFVYGYLALALFLAVRFVSKEEIKHKFELAVFSFYLMTGNLNNVLKIKIPGISFFEIQPERLLFFLLLFFLLRRFFTGHSPYISEPAKAIPLYKVFLYFTAFLITLSQIINISAVGAKEVIVNLVMTLTFLMLIHSLQVMSNEETFQIIGKSIVIGAIFSAVIGLIQFLVEPYFMRLGIVRIAYGNVFRANGIFGEEYYHSYFLVIATVWVIVFEKRETLKLLLIGLFSLGILISFHRMSMLTMGVILAVYFIYIRSMSLRRLVFFGLLGSASVITALLLFSDVILSSTAVRERLLDSVGGRKGYYAMVFDHIGEKPLLGFGSSNNDVYYYSMLEITHERERATGEVGSIHNGYLETMFFYGIPAFCCFTAFVLLAMLYFGKLTTRHIFFAIPFMLIVIYFLSNLTNSFIFSKYLSILLAIHIGLGMGARYMPAYFDKQTDLQADSQISIPTAV
jgi:hypothetical protein